MTHFAQFHDPAIIPLLVKSGIIQFRDEQYWSWIEQKQGVYKYPQKYLDYMASGCGDRFAAADRSHLEQSLLRLRGR